MRFSIHSLSEDQTAFLAFTLGSLLKGSDIIGLRGELGAGKTYFVKGLAKGLNIKENVSSPSFTLINEYEGEVPLFHFDLYRLEDEREIEELGLNEYFYGKGVCAVEWVEKLKGLIPKDLIYITISVENEAQRVLEFSCKGTHYKEILEQFYLLINKEFPKL